MSEAAIRVEGVSKLYRIGASQRYKALRDTLTDALHAPFRIAASFLKSKRPEDAEHPSNSFIWALKDVSFEIKQGEAVGVIGRNGSGKSTLLKVLSRITEPTEGCARVQGRVASLLEVGTGFHPELTGRENVYLNGAILGMRKAEISRSFDAIVAFAEVERFIDTPVKFYSTGMYVRLAFAVAAHIEPEVLLVDEVLAVGDARFQKKCIGKMQEVEKAGRTVLFVSHNMQTIIHLCPRCIWLDEGQIKEIGETKKVVSAYLSAGSQRPELILTPDIGSGYDPALINAIRSIDDSGKVRSQYMISEPVNLQVDFRVVQPDGVFSLFVSVSREGVWAFMPVFHGQFEKGLHRMTCHIPAQLLNDSYHEVYAHMQFNNEGIISTEPIVFDIIDDGSSPGRGDYTGLYSGAVRPYIPWSHQVLET